MLLTVDTPGALACIDDPEICRNAFFQFDKPVICSASTVIEMIDGQFFRVVCTDDDRELWPLDGRWIPKVGT